MNPWVIHVFAAIPHQNATKILLIPADDRWTLPRFTIDRMYSALHLFQRAVREHLQAEMTVLRWIWEDVNETERIIHGVWLLDNHTPDWTPPDGAQWVDLSTLANTPLQDETMRPALEQTLTLLEEDAPSQRPPWFQRGWFRQAQQWMQDTLEAHGYTLLASPEQFKQFNISSVLRAETDAGAFYMKVALDLPLFGHEPKLMQKLSALIPHQIPGVLVIDAERRWMLSPDFGVMLRGSDPSYELLERTMQDYARLQIYTANLHDALLEAGCHDRRLPVLMSQIDDLLADEDCYSGLNEEERTAWQASAPALKNLCQQLASYHIPYTLVHGDFHAGNVTLRGDDVLFFDWTDACIAHPFFDPPVLIEFDAAEHADALRDAYLSCWIDYEPMERLQRAYQLAQVAGYLHQAISYQGIRNGVEPFERKSWDWAVPHFARLILKEISLSAG